MDEAGAGIKGHDVLGSTGAFYAEVVHGSTFGDKITPIRPTGACSAGLSIRMAQGPPVRRAVLSAAPVPVTNAPMPPGPASWRQLCRREDITTESKFTVHVGAWPADRG